MIYHEEITSKIFKAASTHGNYMLQRFRLILRINIYFFRLEFR
jgi:hypothetical protein